jgi:hypothetical protein
VAQFKEPFSIVTTIRETVLNGPKWSPRHLRAFLESVYSWYTYDYQLVDKRIFVHATGARQKFARLEKVPECFDSKRSRRPTPQSST